MESRFSVDTTIDADIQYEASKSLMPRYVQLLTWVCFGLSVVLLGIMVWQYIMTKNTMHLVLALLLVLVVGYALFNQLRGPRTALRRWQQNIQSKYGSNALHLHTDFYDLTLAQTLQENGEVLDAGYSTITELRETEHLFLLHCGRQQWYFVNKAGFTEGHAGRIPRVHLRKDRGLIMRSNSGKPLGIYVHIPFCKSKCEYCDFYSLGGSRDRRTTDQYLQALADHIRETGRLAPDYTAPAPHGRCGC